MGSKFWKEVADVVSRGWDNTKKEVSKTVKNIEEEAPKIWGEIKDKIGDVGHDLESWARKGKGSAPEGTQGRDDNNVGGSGVHDHTSEGAGEVPVEIVPSNDGGDMGMNGEVRDHSHSHSDL